jgi:electron transport complex protein RnfB
VGSSEEKRAREALDEALSHYTARIVPVRVELTSAGTVLALDEAKRILATAKVIALGPCTCRVQAGRCDAPVETCLAVDATAERNIETIEGFRRICVDEALDVLRESHKAGLVHLAYRQQGMGITEFCSCCSCCCWFLTKVKSLGAYAALTPSAYQAQREDERCAGCGACARRCPFDAWTTTTRGLPPEFDRSRCVGCGVCVSGCPTEALRLVPRDRE